MTEPRTLTFHVAVTPDAAGSETAMLRLACKFQSDFKNERAVEAYIFDDPRAAKDVALRFTDQRHYGGYLWHVRGRYVRNKQQRLAFVEWISPVFNGELLTFNYYKTILDPS